MTTSATAERPARCLVRWYHEEVGDERIVAQVGCVFGGEAGERGVQRGPVREGDHCLRPIDHVIGKATLHRCGEFTSTSGSDSFVVAGWLPGFSAAPSPPWSSQDLLGSSEYNRQRTAKTGKRCSELFMTGHVVGQC